MNDVEMQTPKENWQKIVNEMKVEKKFENTTKQRPNTLTGISSSTVCIKPPPLYSEVMREPNFCENKKQFPKSRPNNMIQSITRTTFPIINHHLTRVMDNYENSSTTSTPNHKNMMLQNTNYDPHLKERRRDSSGRLPKCKNPNCETKYSPDSLDRTSINSPLPPKLMLNLAHDKRNIQDNLKCNSKHFDKCKGAIFRKNLPMTNCVSTIVGLRALEASSKRTPQHIPVGSPSNRKVTAIQTPLRGQQCPGGEKAMSQQSRGDSYYEYSEMDDMILDSETPSLFLDEDFIRKMHKSNQKKKAKRKRKRTSLYGRSAAFRQVQLYQINGKRTKRRTNRKGIIKKTKVKSNEISTNFFLALFTMLCCCPLGVMSMFYVCKVKRNLAKNDREGARVSSLAGRKLGNTGVMLGITALAMTLILLVVKANLPYANIEYDYYLPEYESG